MGRVKIGSSKVQTKRVVVDGCLLSTIDGGWWMVGVVQSDVHLSSAGEGGEL
jgi:hypothetical protein